MTENIAEPAPPNLQNLLAAASEARKQGQLRVASDNLAAALSLHAKTGEAIPRTLQFDLAALLFNQGRLDEALAVVTAALERRPKDFALVNLHGVVLKALGRLDEALKQFDLAAKLDPTSLSPLVNRGNIYLMQRDGKRAIDVFTLLTRKEPRSAEYQRLLASGYRAQGELDKALSRLEMSQKLDPKHANTWREIAAVLDELGRNADALATLERGIAAVGPQKDLVDAQISCYAGEAAARRRSPCWNGSSRSTPARRGCTCRWAAPRPRRPRPRQQAFRRSGEAGARKHPHGHRAGRKPRPDARAAGGAEHRRRLRARHEAAHDEQRLIQDAKTLRGILIRSGDYEAAETLGDFDELCTHWASAGEIAGLHHMMGQVRTPAQRRSLVQHHRNWGRKLELLATKTSITKPPARAGRAKMRVGFMSSDLRDHPVAYFAVALLGYDRSRFEFYAIPGAPAQPIPSSSGSRSRWTCSARIGLIGERAAAQLIADDGLDMLFELGGSTDMNKIDVMAYRPAPRTGELAGLSRIRRAGLDRPHPRRPYIMPDDPALLIEKPFRVTRSWVALHKPGFGPMPDRPDDAEERTAW